MTDGIMTIAVIAFVSIAFAYSCCRLSSRCDREERKLRNFEDDDYGIWNDEW